MSSSIDPIQLTLLEKFIQEGRVYFVFQAGVVKSISQIKMTKHNQKIGQWGEAEAARWLETRGCEIVARNVRTPYGEIDIIARQGDVVIFVEVKARTSNKMGLPEESVNARKREHLLACAEYYASEHEVDHWQIDVISVEGRPGDKPLITHFENAI